MLMANMVNAISIGNSQLDVWFIGSIGDAEEFELELKKSSRILFNFIFAANSELISLTVLFIFTLCELALV